MKVTIYTDGAARGNPDGPGGFGTVIHYVDPAGKLHTKEISGGYKRTTNNRMELMAAIAGLEALNRPCEIELYSDSQLVTAHTCVPSNRILPMLRIPNRQNLHPELYCTEFSVQKIPTCE